MRFSRLSRADSDRAAARDHRWAARLVERLARRRNGVDLPRPTVGPLRVVMVARRAGVFGRRLGVDRGRGAVSLSSLSARRSSSFAMSHPAIPEVTWSHGRPSIRLATSFQSVAGAMRSSSRTSRRASLSVRRWDDARMGSATIGCFLERYRCDISSAPAGSSPASTTICPSGAGAPGRSRGLRHRPEPNGSAVFHPSLGARALALGGPDHASPARLAPSLAAGAVAEWALTPIPSTRARALEFSGRLELLLVERLVEGLGDEATQQPRIEGFGLDLLDPRSADRALGSRRPRPSLGSARCRPALRCR